MGFLSGVQDWFEDNPWAGYALPVATSTLLPNIGGSIGGALNEGLGLDLSPQATQAVGNALFSGGLGALTGGAKGALAGAAIGGLTPYVAGLFGSTGPIVGGLPHESQGGYGPEVPGSSSSGSSSSGSSGSSSGLFGEGALAKALPLIAAVGLAGGALGGSKKPGEEHVIGEEQQAAIDKQRQPLSKVTWKQAKPTMPKGDLTQYGYGPEHTFFKNNRLPQEYARGGAIQCYADGGDVEGALAVSDEGALDPMAHQQDSRYFVGPGAGRDDAIDAKVSNNEYVFDAETVALLGDGSPDAGAAALDEMRKNIRRYKGGALAVGEISPPALPPEEYLPRGVL